MAIIEKFVEVFGGTGGLANNAVPVYGAGDAPNGAWAFGLDGASQLMWENGKKLVCVDPTALSSLDKATNFVNYKDGKISYVRVWLFDPNTLHGVEYMAGKQTWVEWSHLKPFSPVSQPEQPDDGSEVPPPILDGAIVLTINNITIGGVTVSFSEPIIVNGSFESI